MKFILSFLLAFIFISPVMAFTPPNCSVYNGNETVCRQLGGCLWFHDEEGYGPDACQLCPSGFACNGGVKTQCTNNLGDGKQHPAGASSCDDWICDTTNNYIQVGNNCLQCSGISAPMIFPASATTCNDWMCDAGWYKSGTECKACPDNSSSVAGEATSISDCHCNAEPDEYIIANPEHVSSYGYPYFCEACGAYTTYDPNTFSCVCNVTYSHQDSLLTCACPTHSTPNEGTCVCDSGWYMPVPSNEQNPRPIACLSCPEHAACSNNEVTCDQNTIKTVSDDGTVICATCGANAGVYDGACKCDVNAYGNGTNCTKCPAGTFLTTRGTEASPTAVTGCRMTHETLFCDANGENCMQLIPES